MKKKVKYTGPASSKLFSSFLPLGLSPNVYLEKKLYRVVSLPDIAPDVADTDMEDTPFGGIEALLQNFLEEETVRFFGAKLASSKYTVATLLEMSEQELDEIMNEEVPEVARGDRRGFKKAILSKKRKPPQELNENSGEWMKYMLRPQPIKLPRNPRDLTAALFPEDHGKLPVTRATYLRLRRGLPPHAFDFFVEANDSELPLRLSALLIANVVSPVSEQDVSLTVGNYFKTVFSLYDMFYLPALNPQLSFNSSERSTGTSNTEASGKQLRPDTLVIAGGCTFLVGEDNLDSLSAAEDDILRKMRPLCPMFYGEVQFILGYVAAGTEFQWVYIGNDGKKVVRIQPCLNFTNLYDRCQILLSLGNAYLIMKKMVESIPDVPGRRAMFSEEEDGNRTIYFQSNSVRKTIRNFSSYCIERGTTFDLICQAYKVAQLDPSLLLEVVSEPELDRRDTYSIEIGPLGYYPMLRSEYNMKLLARDVLKALSVLHTAELVHRDIRLPNIVQVSAERFMLIDLETVAKSPFRLPEGFQPFAEWSMAMLEDGHYTPKSDLYQLGVLLESRGWDTAKKFITSLKSKQWTAAEVLKDAWLSNLPSP